MATDAKTALAAFPARAAAALATTLALALALAAPVGAEEPQRSGTAPPAQGGAKERYEKQGDRQDENEDGTHRSGTGSQQGPPGGLLPFMPEWFPLGPSWEPEPTHVRRQPATLPETMVPDSPVGSVPRPDLPLPEDEEADDWSLVPVPILYADPNLGFGSGLMPVVLVHPAHRIEWILAPSMDWNDLLGLSATSRIYYYPTLQEELFVYNDFSTEGKTEHEARFHGRDRFVRDSDFVARGYYVKDPTRRFFGLGPYTEEAGETSYEQDEVAMEADIGYFFLPVLRFGTTVRYRSTRLHRGIVPDRPDTVDVYKELGGVREPRTDVLAMGLRATLDLRNDEIFPSLGLVIDAFGEVSARGMISTTSFWRWGVSLTGFLPIPQPFSRKDDALVLALHGDWHEVNGDDRLPFWEMPALGGRSQLRGFGAGRFTGDGYLLFSVEPRARLAELEIRRNRLRIEAAGFFDLGRVYGRDGGLTDEAWQLVPGVGARILIVDSGIVARGDIGFGSEGPAIFLVLGYPF